MSQSNQEWQKAKAEQVLRGQVEAISRSQFPNSDFALGFVEAYYSVDLLNDLSLGYWRQAVENAVQVRRQELRNNRHKGLFDQQIKSAVQAGFVPEKLGETVPGELVAVQDHSLT